MLAPLLKGVGLGILLAISVGPIIFSIIKQSIEHGHKGGYFFIAGIAASDVTLVVICNFFSSLFQSLLHHEKIIARAGSILLLVLGVYSLFFKKPSTTAPKDAGEKVFKKHERLGIFASGFLMNILNPGALFFWFLWTAAIIADAATAAHPAEYRFIVFATCLLVNFSTDVMKVLLAGKLRNQLTVKVMHRIDQFLGLLLIGFGIALILGTFGIINFLH